MCKARTGGSILVNWLVCIGMAVFLIPTSFSVAGQDVFRLNAEQDSAGRGNGAQRIPSPDPLQTPAGSQQTNAGQAALQQAQSGQAQSGQAQSGEAQAGSAQPARQDDSADNRAGDPTGSTAESQLENRDESLDQSGSQAKKKVADGDSAVLWEQSSELLIVYGLPAILSLIVLIVSYFVASFLSRLASQPIQRKVDETLGRFIGKMIFYTMMAGAVLGVLQSFGIGVASFAAVIAAAGFAIGLAFQGTLSNFASGVMLLVFRPFKVGDVVNAAGITAKIHMVDLFTTVFDTFDNRRIVVPNSSIMGDMIENITYHPERRVDVNVGVEYGANIAATREVLNASVAALDDVCVEGEGRGYQVVLGELGDSAVQWTVRMWVKRDDFLAAKERLTESVKNHLDDAGIGIPYPQMDVHLHQMDKQ